MASQRVHLENWKPPPCPAPPCSGNWGDVPDGKSLKVTTHPSSSRGQHTGRLGPGLGLQSLEEAPYRMVRVQGPGLRTGGLVSRLLPGSP